MRKEILFLIPPTQHSSFDGWDFFDTVPLPGVASLATILSKSGYQVFVYDARKNIDILRNLETHPKEDVAFVGISSYSDGFVFLEEFTKDFKIRYPKIPLVAGGSLPTSMSDFLLTHTQIDIILRGEAENSIKTLANILSQEKYDVEKLKKIPEIVLPNCQNKIANSQNVAIVNNLNSLPIPNYDSWMLENEKLNTKKMVYNASRGCPYACPFCFPSNSFRIKTLKRIELELRELMDKLKMEFCYFIDPVFNLVVNQNKDILKILEQMKLNWGCMMRPQSLDKQLIHELRETGCYTIWYGVESFNQRVLDENKKGTNVNEILKILKDTMELGIEAVCFLVLGLPGETEKSLNDSIQLITKYDNLIPRPNLLNLLPGTQLYHTALKEGKITSEKEHLCSLSKGDVNSFINLTSLKKDIIIDAYYKLRNIMKHRTPQVPHN